MDLPGFDRYEYTAAGRTRPVYRRGTGRGILLIHELPGMTPECVELGRRIADAGFDVHMPLLFGKPGKREDKLNFLRVCISSEFNKLATDGRSPITDWLRPLCNHINADGPGIGVIGMCFTGGFALSMLMEKSVIAPVTSQPAVPIFARTQAAKAALGIPEEHVRMMKARADGGVDVLGWRFTRDTMCPRERFDTLHGLLGPRFLNDKDVPSGPDSAEGIPEDAHSVLTYKDPQPPSVQAAVQRTIQFLRERLA